MRTTISFSALPRDIQKTRRLARARGFQNVSEYLRFLLDQDDVDLISEDELVRRASKIEKLHRQGKLNTAKSMADLLAV